MTRTTKLCYCGSTTMITRACSCVPFVIPGTKLSPRNALHRLKYADPNCRRCYGSGTQRLTNRYCTATNRPMKECAG